jgi:hypothetical protein
MAGWLRRRSAQVALLAGIACALAAVAAAAYAAIPSSGNVIHGCYDKAGALRVIDTDTGGKCAKGEQALAWNQQGPQGVPGLKGDKGDPGQSGQPGPGVTNVALAPGADDACPTGGTKFVGSSGAVSYACSHDPWHRGTWTVPGSAGAQFLNFVGSLTGSGVTPIANAQNEDAMHAERLRRHGRAARCDVRMGPGAAADLHDSGLRVRPRHDGRRRHLREVPRQPRRQLP